jgi:hypothetical protein
LKAHLIETLSNCTEIGVNGVTSKGFCIVD